MRLINVDVLIDEIKQDTEKAIEQDDRESAFWLGYIAGLVIKQPTIQPEPQWIPVSERLPEEYGNYLISIHGEDEPDIGTINPNDKRGWSLCDANGFYWAGDKKLIVTAWMPLPSPYQKGATP